MRIGKRTLLSVFTVAAIAVLLIAAPATADSEGNTQISATAVFDENGQCHAMESMLTFVISGDLVGCWYTPHLEGVLDTPSGVYQEVGEETFVGCLADGTTCGTFDTTYRATAKFDENGEVWGACEHPFVKGSGTLGFTGIEGRVNWKDDVETGLFYLEGHFAIR